MGWTDKYIHVRNMVTHIYHSHSPYRSEWICCRAAVVTGLSHNLNPIILNQNYLNELGCFRYQTRFKFNPKETSWGLKGPVAYISYHCVIWKESYSLETLCIPQEYCFTQYYVWNKLDCNSNKILQIVLWKSYTKDWNGPLRPGAILVRNSNKMTYL